MEAMREAWTDERLDDLNRKVEQGFARLDADLRSHRADSSAFRGEMNERFEGLEGRIGALTRTLVLMNGTIIAALIGLIATQI